MIQIESDQLRILLSHIRLAFGQPDNKAAWFQGRAALTTLEDYLRAEHERPPLSREDQDNAKAIQD